MEASMAVDEPRDVLAELRALAADYRGPIPWSRSGRTPSNPVKLRARYTPTAVFAHTLPRTALSAREGAALLYALQSQPSRMMPGILFSRAFKHCGDGRELVLEDGVLSDLLAVGVISQTPSPERDEFVVTGLGQAEIARCFPGQMF
jgi:hypothetical protein